MFTLDANIFVRDADPRDPDHTVCHTLLELLATTPVVIVEPLIVLAEVAGALSRELRDPMRGRIVTELLLALPNVQFVPIDERLARAAADVAADHGLRGMDALYVAVAQDYGTTLVTLDGEPRRRAAAVVTTMTPAEAIRELNMQS